MVGGDGGGRPRSRLLREPLALVLLTGAVGLVLTWLHHARVGLYVVSAALVAGAALRVVLPARDAGLLVNRSRALDALLLTGMAVAVAVLAAVTPRT